MTTPCSVVCACSPTLLPGQIEREEAMDADPVHVLEDEYHEFTESSMGLCIACREWTGDCVEPDACAYMCPVCHVQAVYGAEECLLRSWLVFDEE